MKKIIWASLLAMTMVATLAMAQIGAEGEGKNRLSKTTSVNLSHIIMHPGENIQIVLDENESVTFEFQLPNLVPVG